MTAVSEPAAGAYAYLILSAALFAAWLVLYAVSTRRRREMLRVSLGTMPLGLTEPLFVPEYWNPSTLLNLAHRPGFNLESLLFSFSIGGIVFAAYHSLLGSAPAQSIAHERRHPRHRYHLLASSRRTSSCSVRSTSPSLVTWPLSGTSRLFPASSCGEFPWRN
ncbi:MAG: hypothetical protein HY614_02815 [Candidatus Rokubacteria bacterium]|nr:hypothetical protein [Candidatus Rokubacteria bacterium]